MRFVYPKGLRKALTFSYDDGQIYDRRLAELLRSHGMKGTFHLNSGNLEQGEKGSFYVAEGELQEVYRGHEIACHGVQHRNPTTITGRQLLTELQEDREKLEKLTGEMVQGLSYAFGSYSPEVIETAKMVGIKYSRTVNGTHGFFPPADFMQWHPTCHHDDRLLELGDSFLDVAEYYELPLMYVWGHSFEFGRSGDWSVIEAFAEKMAGKADTWYATNGEICNYISAVRRQEFSADGLTMYNPTAVSVWVSTKEGLREIKSGETVYIGEH
ncbi:MAG: polysaccharide deacetylase family protein [Butyrivibrio sp.]|nr:polysaccharide deacetylase family protein [Acetatifactor muris]MCM1558754.1 polysaccharide deacetylase family protein [Butyrivibrio sp.]